MSTSANSNSAIPSSLVEDGQAVYEKQLRGALEPEHSGEFVAIEPATGRHFPGKTPPLWLLRETQCPQASSSSPALAGTQHTKFGVLAHQLGKVNSFKKHWLKYVSSMAKQWYPNRKAVTSSSPGLPLRLPWVANGLRPNRNAVAPSADEEMTQPLCGG